ncbi:MAG: YebC/PmpR family DNA-binding transcriptional regulator [Patescibacteria group bacterium]
MSGHSKWSTIKRQKESTDIKRGLLFSKLARAITIAAREGVNPDANFKLRLAIDRARAANMPKDNIERAITKAVGGAAVEEVTYEGYGPSGVAVVVQAVTDNKNRTAQEIKNLFERGGGRLGNPGSVSYQFEELGQLLVQKTSSPEEQMLALIDAGVEDLEETPDGIEIFVNTRELSSLREKINELGFGVVSSEFVLRPKNLITINNQSGAQKVVSFLENIQAHDDVQNVWANIDIPQEVLGQIGK